MRCWCQHGCSLCTEWNARQSVLVAWAELTFAQIRALPVTTDCPPEERFPA